MMSMLMRWRYKTSTSIKQVLLEYQEPNDSACSGQQHPYRIATAITVGLEDNRTKTLRSCWQTFANLPFLTMLQGSLQEITRFNPASKPYRSCARLPGRILFLMQIVVRR